jgi:hypothetical protein
LAAFSASAMPYWTPLVNQPTFQPGVALLLTDGSVMVQSLATNNWWRLTPDNSGSYINGTWSPLASTAEDYAPIFYSSAVLPDGRVVVIGGEYNAIGGSIGSDGDTAKGAIYDPTADVWTPLAAPQDWPNIGDSPSVVLPDGTFMVGNAVLSDPQPALLDAATLTWKLTGALGEFEYSFSEQGLTLMQTGRVLTITVGDNKPVNAQIYNPDNGTWRGAGNTGVTLVSPNCSEIGPALSLPNGDVFAIGSTSNTAIYHPANGTWLPGPVLPDSLGVSDGPAALLPNGHVLVQASPQPTPAACFIGGSRFFEFDGSAFIEVPAPPGADQIAANSGLMLVLPTGQIFYSGSGGVQIYTSSGTYDNAWAPTISSAPDHVNMGGTNYAISGTQFNGLSQGAMYGDDAQMATNYPLVRITNNVSGHVVYAKTHDHSTMAIGTGATPVSTQFDVPFEIEPGASKLVVVANGIPSAPVDVVVDFVIGPGMTGNWYDVSESGHGFSVEVLPDNQMLAEWFVFAPDGGPAWIAATGPISGNSAVLQGFQTVGPGGRFPPNFDPTQVQSEPWGELTFTFTDCNTGSVSWQPSVTGYISGSIPLARLTLPAGLTCP